MRADWHLTGIGYHTDAERDIAAAIADQAAERRRERASLTLKCQPGLVA